MMKVAWVVAKTIITFMAHLASPLHNDCSKCSGSTREVGVINDVTVQHYAKNQRLPDSIAVANADILRDCWGNSYNYEVFGGAKSLGRNIYFARRPCMLNKLIGRALPLAILNSSHWNFATT